MAWLNKVLVSAAGALVIVGSLHAADSTGEVAGTVRMEGAPPPLASFSTSGRESVCGPAKADASLRVQGGALEGAIVRLEGDLPRAEPRPLEISIDQCELRPRVSVAVQGGRLFLRNNDPAAHQVLGFSPPGEAFFHFLQPIQGSRNAKLLDKPGLLELRGGPEEPWLSGFVYVAPHPFVTTSDARGAFQMGEVPPGRYTLVIWHERLGTLSQAVQVEAGKTSTAEVAFRADKT